MSSSLHGRFLILDFGYPMNNNTVTLIKKSLENVITVATTFPISSTLFQFGISVVNSEFVIADSIYSLGENCSSFLNKIDDLDEIPNINEKITAKNYKEFLKDSIEKIQDELHLKSKQRKYYSCDQGQQSIQITLITKKTASLLVSETLLSIGNETVKNQSQDITSRKNIRVIQIMNEKEEFSTNSQKNINSVEWITCPNNSTHLDSLLKDWLLKPDKEFQQLEIQLSQEIDLTIKCDVDDGIIHTYSSPDRQKLGSWSDFLMKSSDIKIQSNTLRLLKRLSLHGVCPSYMFGTSRHLYASSSSSQSWNESDVNQKIFKELCRELSDTDQGLLASLYFYFEGSELTAYYMIMSTGSTLLLNSVASEELILPRRSSFELSSDVDPNATYIVKTSLEKIRFLEEYSPLTFSSGLYEHLKNKIKQPKLLSHIDSSLRSSVVKIPIKNKFKKSKTKQKKNFGKETVEDDDLINCTSEINPSLTSLFDKRQSTKQQKTTEIDKTHPALLSPNTAKKYRKFSYSVFSLPELSDKFNEGLL